MKDLIEALKIRKKYIVTDKNEYFKEGAILEIDEIDGVANINGLEVILNGIDIDLFLERGWIKEVQEKEFTKDDMIDFSGFASRRVGDNEYILNAWIEHRAKEKQ